MNLALKKNDRHTAPTNFRSKHRDKRISLNSVLYEKKTHPQKEPIS
jgi:hypothetical protein